MSTVSSLDRRAAPPAFQEYQSAKSVYFACARLRSLVASLVNLDGQCSHFPTKEKTVIDKHFTDFCREQFLAADCACPPDADRVLGILVQNSGQLVGVLDGPLRALQESAVPVFIRAVAAKENVLLQDPAVDYTTTPREYWESEFRRALSGDLHRSHEPAAVLYNTLKRLGCFPTDQPRTPGTATTKPEAAGRGAEYGEDNAAGVKSEHWFPFNHERIQGYMGGRSPDSYKGQLTKMTLKHPELRRDATADDREHFQNPRLRYVFNIRILYELTEGAAIN
ncbi:MAG: hypothetical protein IT449_04825 [Phycisphaerales bacterium]|nr:hypothetical protein [Phycisphaerales bacterium]